MNPDPPTEIPEHELKVLLLAVSEAIAFAASRRPADGYTILLLGLERVRDYPDPWAAELELRWQLSMERYCHLFGVKDGPAVGPLRLPR